MDAAVTPQVNNRGFAIPLCLLSLVFFNAYVLILLWYLPGMMRSWLNSAAVSSTAEILNGPIPGLFTCGFILMVSLAGTFLLLREMRDVSSARVAGIPLCIMSCMMGISVGFFIIPSGYFGQFHNQITIYSIVIFLCGFMSLPYGSDYLLRSFRERGFDRIQRESHVAGLFGLVVSTGLLVIVILLTSTWIEDLIPLLIIALVFCIFHLFIVMPVIGIEMIRTGIGFLKEPLAEIESGG